MFERRRKIRVAGVAAVAATALLAAGCGSSSNSSSPSGPSTSGAVATVANINGAGANMIFPFASTQFYSVTNYSDFIQQFTEPLYVFGSGSPSDGNTSISVNYPLSPAAAPVYSDGGKTVTITMKGWKFSNGETVSAKDLIFFLNLLESEKANYAGYTPGLLPDNMASYSLTGANQVTLHLKQALGSIWFTYNQLAILYPFSQAWDVTTTGAKAGSGGCTTDSAADGWAKCKAVYTFLTAQAKNTGTYATNPLWQVVDGPFKLSAYNVSGNYTFVPNSKYSGSPKPSISALKFVTYTSNTAVYTALKTGALSTDGPAVGVPPEDLPNAGAGFVPPSNPLQGAGYTLQPDFQFGIGYAYINFNNPTYGPAFKQLYFRQAMMELDNQQGMAQKVNAGYGYPTPAGIPPYPRSQWVTPIMKENNGQGPYPYNPAKASALLAAHGWKKVGGVLTCQSSACGPGVKKGTQAKFTIQYSSGSTTQTGFVQVLKSGFAQAGIQITGQPETFNSLLKLTVPCKATQAACNWTLLYLGGWLFNGPGFEPTGEPLYSTGSPNNSGSYSDPKMDALINATHTSNDIAAFQAYATYNAQQVPALWFPWATGIQAVSNNLHNVTQNPLLSFFPQYWTCSNKTCR
jgi:peptide/nickel transport system substrate-binding protein